MIDRIRILIDAAKRTIPIVLTTASFVVIISVFVADGPPEAAVAYDRALLTAYVVGSPLVVLAIDGIVRFPRDAAGYERIGVHAVRVLAITTANRFLLSGIMLAFERAEWSVAGVVTALFVSAVFLPGPVVGTILGWEWATRRDRSGGWPPTGHATVEGP